MFFAVKGFQILVLSGRIIGYEQSLHVQEFHLGISIYVIDGAGMRTGVFKDY